MIVRLVILRHDTHRFDEFANDSNVTFLVPFLGLQLLAVSFPHRDERLRTVEFMLRYPLGGRPFIKSRITSIGIPTCLICFGTCLRPMRSPEFGEGDGEPSQWRAELSKTMASSDCISSKSKMPSQAESDRVEIDRFARGAVWVIAEVCVRPQTQLHVLEIIWAQFCCKRDWTSAVRSGRPHGHNATEPSYCNAEIWSSDPGEVQESGTMRSTRFRPHARRTSLRDFPAGKQLAAQSFRNLSSGVASVRFHVF